MRASELSPEQRLCVALIHEAVREANRGCDADRRWLLVDAGLTKTGKVRLGSFRWCASALDLPFDIMKMRVLEYMSRKELKNTQSIAGLLRGVS